MNLLFITHARLHKPPYGDGSTRYRCFHIAEVARRAGHRAVVRSASTLNSEDLHYYDLISWSRPVDSRHLHELLNVAQQRNIVCIADLDDLIVRPDLADQSPAVINGFTNPHYLQKKFTRHARAVNLFDAITTSTDNLKDQIQSVFPDKPIATIANGLSEFWLEHARSISAENSDSRSIAYLPGTRSHDDDFAGIRDTLIAWLSDATDRRLDVVGKIDIKTEHWPRAQVTQRPWTDYYHLPAIINSYCATLAPLSDSVFNRSKSHVKFIESAAMGVPLIASPIRDIAQHRTTGLLLASDASQWLAALDKAGNREFRTENAKDLTDYALEHCMASNFASELVSAWNSGLPLPQNLPTEPSLRAA
ncbi:MAG: hypothetical protein KTR32_18105 [Granulosicoccus sp.]|nr:hypothetical protein [Granulosicoccus sp.]